MDGFAGARPVVRLPSEPRCWQTPNPPLRMTIWLWKHGNQEIWVANQQPPLAGTTKNQQHSPWASNPARRGTADIEIRNWIHHCVAILGHKEAMFEIIHLGMSGSPRLPCSIQTRTAKTLHDMVASCSSASCHLQSLLRTAELVLFENQKATVKRSLRERETQIAYTSIISWSPRMPKTLKPFGQLGIDQWAAHLRPRPRSMRRRPPPAARPARPAPLWAARPLGPPRHPPRHPVAVAPVALAAPGLGWWRKPMCQRWTTQAWPGWCPRVYCQMLMVMKLMNFSWRIQELAKCER